MKSAKLSISSTNLLINGRRKTTKASADAKLAPADSSGQHRLLPTLPRQHLSAACRCQDLAVLINDFPAADRNDRPASDLPACKNRELCIRQFVLVADGPFQI